MKYIIVYITLLLIAVFGFSMPVYADTPDPDSVLIPDIYVNRHLLETNDMLIYFNPAINYSSNPDLAIDDAFTFRLLDTDGVTVLASRDAYNFTNDGYGPTVLSFYCDNSTAPTWGLSYIISITGKPGAFDDPPIYNFTIDTSDYTSETTQADNQAEVRDNIINIAMSLSTSMSIDLLSQTETGTALSEYGENLFRNTIPGLQAMVPDLFQLVLYYPDWDERGWTSNVSDNYTSRYVDTDEGNAIGDFFSAMLNIDMNVGAAIPIMVLIAIFMIMSAKMSNQIYSGMINSAAAIIIAAPMGWMPMAIVSIVAFILAFYSSFRLFRPA